MKPIHNSAISSVVSQPHVTVLGFIAGFCKLFTVLSQLTQTLIRLPAGRFTGSRNVYVFCWHCLDKVEILDDGVNIQSGGKFRSCEVICSGELKAHIFAERRNFMVRLMHRVLEMPESGYCKWCQRKPSRRAQVNAKLLAALRGIMVEGNSTCGTLRIAAQPRKNGIKASLNRVARRIRDLSAHFGQQAVSGGRAERLQQ